MEYPMIPTPMMTWHRATGLASLAVYGPFIIMAGYTLLFISCDHCKKAAWMTLPFGPGLLPLEFLRQCFNFSRPPAFLWWTLAFLIPLAFIASLAWLLRLGKVQLSIGLTVVCILSSIAAFCVLSMIRA